MAEKDSDALVAPWGYTRTATEWAAYWAERRKEHRAHRDEALAADRPSEAMAAAEDATFAEEGLDMTLDEIADQQKRGDSGTGED